MMELRSRIFRSNGDRVYFSRSATGEYRWVDAITNLTVPDSRAHWLDFLYGHKVNHIRAKSNGDEANDDAHVAAVAVEDAKVVDACDAIVSRGGDAQDDVQYNLAVDDMESLSEMGSGQRHLHDYTDDEKHPADANDDIPLEMVA